MNKKIADEFQKEYDLFVGTKYTNAGIILISDRDIGLCIPSSGGMAFFIIPDNK